MYGFLIRAVDGLNSSGIGDHVCQVIVTAVSSAEDTIKMYVRERSDRLCLSQRVTDSSCGVGLSIGSRSSAVRFTVCQEDHISVITVSASQCLKSIVESGFPVGSSLAGITVGIDALNKCIKSFSVLSPRLTIYCAVFSDPIESNQSQIDIIYITIQCLNQC